MAKKDKTINDYIEELKTMVEHRNDGCFDPWLMPMLRATAMNMVILDKIQTSLEKDDICKLMTGSKGQQKTELHPLLDKYDKMQNTLIKQYNSLGLTAKGNGRGSGDDRDDDDPVLTVINNR